MSMPLPIYIIHPSSRTTSLHPYANEMHKLAPAFLVQAPDEREEWVEADCAHVPRRDFARSRPSERAGESEWMK